MGIATRARTQACKGEKKKHNEVLTEIDSVATKAPARKLDKELSNL